MGGQICCSKRSKTETAIQEGNVSFRVFYSMGGHPSHIMSRDISSAAYSNIGHANRIGDYQKHAVHRAMRTAFALQEQHRRRFVDIFAFLPLLGLLAKSFSERRPGSTGEPGEP